MTLVSLQSLLFKSTAFQRYARQNWSLYASMVAHEDVSTIRSLFIIQPKLVEKIWRSFMVPPPASPLQLFSCYELERFILANDDFEFKNNQGWTAIFFASLSWKATMVDPLLQNGANPNAVDNDGRTALHMQLKASGGGSLSRSLWIKVLTWIWWTRIANLPFYMQHNMNSQNLFRYLWTKVLT
jgi:hypothetical protein